MSSPQEPIRPLSTEPAPSQGMVFAALDTAASLDSDAVANTGAIMAEEERADTALLARLAAKKRARRLRFGILAALIVIGLGFMLTRQGQTNKPLADSKLDASQRYNETSVSLGGLDTGPAVSAQGVETLSVNGQLNVNDSLVLNPQEQPLNAVTGQLYYDKSTGRLAYYDGKAFVNVLSGQSNAIVQGVGGLSGNIGVGSGLAAANGALSNTGVLSLQGQSGNVVFTSGSGIDVNGTTVSNTGVLSIAGQTGDITVGNGLAIVGSQLRNSGLLTATAGTNIAITNDGSGNITISATGSAGGGTGGSGTGGTLALWDGSGTVNNLTNSILSQSGGAVTVAGNLSATNLSGNGSGVTNVNAAQLGGQAGSYYTNAGNLSSGTLNDSRLSSNAALYNNTTSNFTGTSLQHNGNEVCDASGNCVGVAGGGIGGGGTAGTLAMFTNGGFTIGDSLLSQDSGAGTISVAGNLSASGTVSATSLAGNGSGVTNVNAVQLGGQAGSYYTNAGNLSSGTLNDSRLSSNAALYNNSTSNFTGNLQQGGNAVCTTAGNCTGVAGGGIGGSGSLNSIALFTGSGYTIGNSLLSQDSGATTVSVAGDLSVSGTVIATSLSGNGSGVTNVNAAQLEGNAASYYTNAGNLSSGTLSDSRLSANAALYNNTTSNFTGALQQAGNDVCTTAGNCAGVGGGVTTSGGTVGTIAVFTGAGFSIGDSLLSQDSGAGTVAIAGDVTVDGSLAATSLSGDGTGVTNVDAAKLGGQSSNYYTNASNLSSGTVADARLSTAVTLQGNIFNGAGQLVQLTAGGLLPVLDGSNLTNVNAISLNGQAGSYYTDASNINSGTLSDSRLSTNIAQHNINNNFTGTLQQNGNDVCTTAGNCLGGGSGGVGGSGTGGKIALFSGTGSSSVIGDSILSQDAGATTVTIAGSLNVVGTSLQHNGNDVCDTSGNCAGAGGGVTTTTGTANTFTIFTGAQTIGNSILTQSSDASTVNLTGDLAVSGNLSATNLSGNGSGVTNVNAALLGGQAGSYYTNASNLSSGTVNDARLSANAALYNGAVSNFTGNLQHNGNSVCDTSGNCAGAGGGVTTSGGTTNKFTIFTGAQTIGDSILSQDAGATTISVTGDLSVSGAVTATSLSGNGSGVTNVNAALLGGQAGSYYTNAGNLSSGTLNNARLSNSVTLQGNTFNGVNQLVQLTASGLLPVLDGSNLTNLNASNIATGTLNDARLSANAALYNNSTSNFTGALQQAGNDVCTTAGNCLGSGGGVGGSGSVNTIAMFNGSGFTIGNSLLSQDAGATTVSIAGGLSVTGNVSAASLSGNGSGVTNVNAAQLGGQAGSYYTNAGNLSSGTLNDSRLSSNAALYNNATSNFTGTNLQHNGNNVCDTSGNCVGVAGGGIGGSGTAGTIALFTGSGFTIGDSLLSQSGTTVTVAGTLAATNLQGNGSAITALNASNLSSGIVASGRLSGAYTGITGTGALTSGSIGGSFGVISTGSAITTIDALTGNTVNSLSGYFNNGVAGSSTTCSGGQFLQNQVVQGGIVTGGTCGTPIGDGTGITTVGTFSTTDTAAGGATISGATITFQSASINAPGMVDTTTQSFAGNKTFTGNLAVNGTTNFGGDVTVASGKIFTVGGGASYQSQQADGTFQAKVDYATGSGPQSVTSGDFNGDGKLDLAVANYTSSTVSLLIGNGDGTFQAKVDYTTGSGPRSVSSGDFNGDGKLDLAVANYTGTVSVLLGNGNGTFQAKVDYATGGTPQGIILGDFNGDGKLDIVTANYNLSGTVSVLLGNGNGTFQAKVDYATGSRPRSVTSGDFNGDGKLDLGVANYNSNTISILIGNGDGTFQAKVDYATGSGPQSVTSGDFNGDGKLDLAVANYTSSTVSLLIGNGDGTFQAKVDYASGGSAISLTTGDFNGDGKLDLAVANNSGSVSVLIGNGNGTLQTKVDYTAGSGAYAITWGDFNGDGSADLAVANYSGTTTSVLIGNTATVAINAGISMTTASGNQAGVIIQGSTGQSADLLHIQNSAGAALFTVSGSGIVSASSFLQNGHTVCDNSGNCPSVTAVGALDGGTANATGATISGSTIYLQSASASFAGLVNTGAQSFAGAKTFTGNTSVANTSATAFQIQNTGGSSTLLTADTVNSRVGVNVTYTQMAAVGTLSSSTATTGGTLAAATYYYKVTAIDSAGGETTPSPEKSQVTTGSTSTVTISWTAIAGASGYKVYRATTTGSEVYLTTVTASTFTDTGSISAGTATPPASNTAYVSTNASNNSLQLSVGGNGTPTGQVYVSGTLPTGALAIIPTSGFANDEAVQGHYSYVVTNLSFDIYDISNPAAPSKVGTLAMGGLPFSVTVQGRYAYVTNFNSYTLQIIDISNPLAPVSVSTSSVGYIANRVVVQGHYAYVGMYGALVIFDISNPAAPVKLSSTATSGGHTISMALQGQYIYLTNSAGNALQIFNVSNPAAPTTVSTTALGSGSAHVVVQGRYAYLTYSNKLQIYDIGNPATPVAAGSVTITGATYITVQNRYAYITDAGPHIWTVDVSNPAAPFTVGGTATTTVGVLAIQGRYGYMANTGGSTFQTFDFGGTYTQSLEAGNLETSNATIDQNLTVNQNTTIAGGLIVGLGAEINGGLGLTGNLTATGNAILQSATNSAAALQVENAAGLGALSVNTSSNTVNIGGFAAPGTVTAVNAAGGSLAASTSYYYEVTAIDGGGGESAVSPEASAATTASNKTINLSWTAVAGATSYRVYRGTATGAENVYYTTATNSYSDTGAASTGGTPPTASTAYAFHASSTKLSFQNATNSTTAFQIQNSAGAAILNVDTTNQNVSVASSGVTTGSAFSVTSSSANQTSGNTAVITQNGVHAQNDTVSGTALNVSRTPTINASTGALAFDANGGAASGGGGSTFNDPISITVGNGNNRYLVAYLKVNATSATITSVKDGSTPMTQIGTFTNAAGTVQGFVYGLVNPPSGVNTVTFIGTSSGGTGSSGWSASSWTNVDQTTPVSGFTTTNGSSTTPAVTVPSAPGNTVVDFEIGTNSSWTVTPGAGQTLRNGYSSFYLTTKAGATSTTMGETLSGSDNWGEAGFSLNQAANTILAVTGAAANISSNCIVTAGTCADSSNVLNLNQQFGSATGAVLNIQNAGSGDMIDFLNGSGTLVTSIDANGNFLTSGTATIRTTSATAFSVQNASSVSLFKVDTSTGTISFGSVASGNYISFTAAGGLVANGTAQHTKTIARTAEYAGAVLDVQQDASCTSNGNGTMTSGYDATGMSYYDWVGNAAAQCYDVVVRVTLPSDFAGWASSTPLTLKTYTTDNSTGLLEVDLRDTTSTGVASCAYASVTPGTNATWTTSGSGCTFTGGTYTAGGVITLRIRMTADSSSEVRLGDLNLSYKSKF